MIYHIASHVHLRRVYHVTQMVQTLVMLGIVDVCPIWDGASYASLLVALDWVVTQNTVA